MSTSSTSARAQTDPPARPAEPADVLLTDGSVAVVRPLRLADRAALFALHDEVGLESLRLRFFSSSREAGHAYVDHLLAQHDTGAVLALGLWQHDDLVGLATAERLGHEAEVAFLVADALHGRGVGTLLLEHLAATARTAGVLRFTAEVLAENGAMIGVFKDAGFEVVRQLDRGVVTVEMDTQASESALRAADAREARAEAASLTALLRPGRVAVVGARRNGSGVGATIIEAIVQGGYAGDLVVVHPQAARVAGVTAYPSFADAPGPVDLVVVAVPPEEVIGCLEQAADAGARAAVVLTSGFAERGEAGAALQRALVRTARDRGIRVVGPHCLGLIDNQQDVRLTATLAGAEPPCGGLAIASQSGGVGLFVIDAARRLGVGVGHFVSLGNKADVSGNDLLAAWVDDPDVTAAALYLESFGNPAKFARIGRRFAECKPLLAVVGGRSGGARQSGDSHTAAAATPSVRIDALFAQAGVIGCRDADELTETALLLSEQPLPGGPRLAVLGNAGGLADLATDAALRHGLEVPVLSDPNIEEGTEEGTENLARTTTRLLVQDEVDAVLLVVAATRTLDPAPALAAVAEAHREHPTKPVVAVLLGTRERGTVPGVTVLPSVDSAVRSLAHAARYAAWLRTPRATTPVTDPARLAVVRRWVTDRLGGEGAGWLGPEAAADLLSPYDVFPAGLVARGPAAAAAAAAEVGLPVAVRVADPAVVRPLERGLVRPLLAYVDDVRAAVATFATETGDREIEVLVQPVRQGIELALGVVRDPALGPMVMVAAGGTAGQVSNDHTLLLAPVTAQDASRALRSLRIWPLLSGYHGSEPVDEQALVDLIVALGRLGVDVPELAEADLDPVVATPQGAELLDVSLRLAGAVTVDAGVPRRLRDLA